MYIIKTVSKSKKNSNEKYYTYRMMESIRVGDKVKKITLLNLGSTFSVDQEHWAQLSKRVDDIIHKRESLFGLESQTLEAMAQEYTKRIIASKAKVASGCDHIDKNDTYKEIDVNTIQNSDAKSIGVEHILHETIKELELDTLFKTLGFSTTQRYSAIGTLVAKCTQPSSEAKAYKWLQYSSAVNELIECDFTKISSNSIYRISDTLHKHKDDIEQYLYTKQKQMFDYEETITLYDLTNTYFEGSAKGIDKAKRGRSKEKRSDAPIITLAVMLDSSGFVKKSKIFDGNVSEAKTFKEMLDLLKVDKREDNSSLPLKQSLVVMDAGIASQENIDYLVRSNYEYIVVSRKSDKKFDKEQAVSVKTNKKDEAIVKACKLINKDGEVELYVHSEAKQLKEESMQQRVEDLFLQKLNYLKDGLAIKGRTKSYEKVLESIGRLKEKYSAIAQYYNIAVTKDPNGHYAIAIDYTKKSSHKTKSQSNGVYCLRSNNTTMDEQTLWRTYTTLTDLESVFKSLKSELGLRPIFHQNQSRVDGHLFITLLSYSIIHTIRYKLKRKGIHDSWTTIRDRLRNRVMVTTSMRCRDGQMLYVRQSTNVTQDQKEIYDALGIGYDIKKKSIVYI